MPVLRRLHDVRVPLSIDTTKAEVARFALDEGVSLLNDISGLQYDPGVGDIAAVRGAPLVLMHMRGRPADMYAHAEYDDVATDVARDLTRAIERAVEPGRALGSDRRRSRARLRQARRAQRRGPGRPRRRWPRSADRCWSVRRASRSWPRPPAGRRPPARDWPTAAAVTAAVLAGAHIVRVHAVAEMVQVVRAADMIREHGTETR